MPDRRFNGIIISFDGTTLGRVTSARYTSNGVKIQVSGADALKKLFRSGIPEEGLSVTYKGSLEHDVGDQGVLSVTWKDNTTPLDLGLCEVFSVDSGGSEDSALETSLTFAPSEAD